MGDVSDSALAALSRALNVDATFFCECVRESAVEIEVIDGKALLTNGSALRLRQLERLCATLAVDVHVALLLLELTRRVNALEEQLRYSAAVTSRDRETSE